MGSTRIICTFVLAGLTWSSLGEAILAQTESIPSKRKSAFRWVNSPSQGAPDFVEHQTFRSQSNDCEVGYCYVLPRGYREETSRRYPVIYWLHGGRPGSETKSIRMASYYEQAMRDGTLPPVLVVFVNGGKVSHYDHEQSLGEQAFLELIQHVDASFRTIADRSGRAVEGFSQGGRGTGRYMFKHPELFCSAAPLGGGHQHELRISQNQGIESETLTIVPATNNTWDLAKQYAEQDNAPELRILIAVGTDDFNLTANREWSEHLTSQQIPHEFIVVPGVPHSSREMYDQIGERIMSFHVKSFEMSGALPKE